MLPSTDDDVLLYHTEGFLQDPKRAQILDNCTPFYRRQRIFVAFAATSVFISLGIGAVLLSRDDASSADPQFPLPGKPLPTDVQNAIVEIRGDLERILQYAVKGPGVGQAWTRAAQICDLFGPRQIGSESLEVAIDEIALLLRKEKFDKVYFEKVQVPIWTRGEESLKLLQPHAGDSPRDLAMLGLGRSVGTGEGIEADVLVVKDLEELVENAHRAVGKVVVFFWHFDNYSMGRTLRSNCASFVAKVGGVAAGISSLASFSLRTPHTGTVKYRTGNYTKELQRPFVPDFFLGNYTDIPHIPAFALAVEEAAMLDRLYRQGQPVRVRLEMGASDAGSRESRNIVAEIQGSEKPDEVVTIGAHLDSWDVSCGAQDDLGPAMVQWQVMSMLNQLSMRPRRTIRMVLFTAEEIGSLGGWQHYRLHVAETEKLSAIFDLDSGIFHFCGIAVAGDAQTVETLRFAGQSLGDIRADHVDVATFRHASNMYMFPADIPVLAPNQAPLNVVQPGHLDKNGDWIESDAPFQGGYWFFHHSVGDRVDALVPAQMDRAAATIATHVYAISMLPERLTRGAYNFSSAQAPCAAPESHR